MSTYYYREDRRGSGSSSEDRHRSSRSASKSMSMSEGDDDYQDSRDFAPTISISSAEPSTHTYAPQYQYSQYDYSGSSNAYSNDGGYSTLDYSSSAYGNTGGLSGLGSSSATYRNTDAYSTLNSSSAAIGGTRAYSALESSSSGYRASDLGTGTRYRAEDYDDVDSRIETTSYQSYDNTIYADDGTVFMSGGDRYRPRVRRRDPNDQRPFSSPPGDPPHLPIDPEDSEDRKYYTTRLDLPVRFGEGHTRTTSDPLAAGDIDKNDVFRRAVDEELDVQERLGKEDYQGPLVRSPLATANDKYQKYKNRAATAIEAARYEDDYGSGHPKYHDRVMGRSQLAMTNIEHEIDSRRKMEEAWIGYDHNPIGHHKRIVWLEERDLPEMKSLKDSHRPANRSP